jgi:uncharacterized damage-inducible protein DinB
MDPGMPFAILLAYNAEETANWKRWFAEHPTALDLPCDVAGAGTVRNLVLHILTTELFFAHRVLDRALPDLNNLPHGSLEELFAIGADAGTKFAQFLAQADDADWSTIQALGFRDLKASKRKMLMQAIFHSIHHRAQLATSLRFLTAGSAPPEIPLPIPMDR